MNITLEMIERLIFTTSQHIARFTQDSPVYPDVWLAYFEGRKRIDTYRLDVILTPHKESSAAELFRQLSSKFISNDLGEENKWQVASNGNVVVARLTLFELINFVLPITSWWQHYMLEKEKVSVEYSWITKLVGAIFLSSDNELYPDIDIKEQEAIFTERFRELFLNASKQNEPEQITVWSVSRNRPATLSIEQSVPATKADSCRKMFEIDGAGICWAVVDSGIDATHPAFRKLDASTSSPYSNAMGTQADKNSNHTRIVATYDFTRFRDVLSQIYTDYKQDSTKNIPKSIEFTSNKDDQKMSQSEIERFVTDIRHDLSQGRMLDWTLIAPLIRIPHNETQYVAPLHPHGSHVAGIIGASLKKDITTSAMLGMCPGINLYDIRVMNEKGEGDEFNILAGLQFIRWINNHRDEWTIHGINISLSMRHEVASYACGKTPICKACETLVSEGTVVVAAAGNLGQSVFQSSNGSMISGFRTVNITDPGNAENVITVGSTHRNRPHEFGVSYFSSKGPTGDGRVKPDIVAPGEKIISTGIDGNVLRMDGTSMAAPHVSGAAALILAKHNELIGQPAKIKKILCSTATDLGREKYFQGCGMLDVLRAIQSV